MKSLYLPRKKRRKRKRKISYNSTLLYIFSHPKLEGMMWNSKILFKISNQFASVSQNQLFHLLCISPSMKPNFLAATWSNEHLLTINTTLPTPRQTPSHHSGKWLPLTQPLPSYPTRHENVLSPPRINGEAGCGRGGEGNQCLFR